MMVSSLNSSSAFLLKNYTKVNVNESDSIQKKASQEQESKKEQKAVKSKEDLDQNEKSQLAKLEQRDTEVRAHEAAHIAAGGGVVKGGASFTYQKGPDNRLYAIGGEVPIDISEGKTPQETIQKMRIVKAAALAPANPSPQDYSVASTASSLEAKAVSQLNKEMFQEMSAKVNGYENSESGNDKSSEINLVA
jgi:hypothetical protein